MDNIVIDFSVTGLEDLEKADAKMEQFGSAQEKAAKSAATNASQFDKLSASLSNVSKNIVNGTSNELTKQIEKFASLGKAQAQVVTIFKDQLSQLDKLKEAYKNAQNPEQAKKLADQIKSVTANVEALQQEITKGKETPLIPENQIEKAVSMKTQLRALKAELALLEDQGKENTVEFEQMAVKAGKLEDQIGDTARRVRVLADDSRGLKTITEGFQGVAAAFQIAQGAQALFGSENKDLQKALVQLNAIMAITNGLTQIQTVLQKQSFIVQQASIIQRRASALSIELETAAEGKGIVVKYAAAAAQRVLNAAQKASPVGLVLTAIVALAGALVYLSSSSKDATEKQTEQNEAQKAALETLKELNELYVKAADNNIATSQRQIDKRKAEGASLQEITTLEKALNEQRVKDATAAVNRLGVNKAAVNEELAELSRLLQKKKTFDEFGVEADSKERKRIESRIALLKDSTATAIDALQKEAEAKAKLIQAQIQAEKDLRSQELNDAKAFADAAVIGAKEGSEAQLKARLDVIEKERTQALAAENLTAGQIAIINAQANDKRLEAENAFLQRKLAARKQADEIALENVKGDLEKELQLRLKILNDEREIIKNNRKLSPEESKNALDKILQQETEAKKQNAQAIAAQQNEIDKADLERRLALSQAGSAEELKIKTALIDAQAQAEKISIANSINSEEFKAAKIAEINTKATKQKTDLLIDYAQKEMELNQQIFEKQASIEIQRLNAKLKLDPNATLADRQAVEDKILAIQNRSLDQQEDIVRQKFIDGKINKQQAEDELLAIKLNRDALEIESEISKADKKKEIEKQLKEFLINSIQQVSDFSFQIAAENRQAQTSAALDDIAARREAELESVKGTKKNLTEEEKKRLEKEKQINDKYKEEERKVKLAAWEADKEASKTQAEINGLLAITAIGTNPLTAFGTPGFFIALAGLVVSTALQVAAIDAKKPPKFAKGTPKAPPGFKWVGEEGPELINDAGGYAIISHPDSMKLAEKYQLPAMDFSRLPQSHKISDEDMVQMLNITQNGIQIDYDKLATTLATKMAGTLGDTLNDVLFDRNKDLTRGGIPITNLGPLVRAIKDSNISDPYRR